MDIFSDDEADPIGLELVRQFDYLKKKFYSIFDDDLNESRADSQLQMGIRSEFFREEVVIVKRDSYSDFRPKQRKVQKESRTRYPYLQRDTLTRPLGLEMTLLKM
jgi:hypothetical protein